ncbi:MAG TPA: hypothetical protein VM597_40880 [Gemmataceae bacterium]|jgi:hypothetical protein|nr:hypothetical protein [Gemmataceae bacterium]
MAYAVSPLFRSFLPASKTPAAVPPGKGTGVARTAQRVGRGIAPARPTVQRPTDYSADRESDPALQRARNVSQYAINILERIRDDYFGQIAKWKTSFDEVVAAFALAVQNRDQVFEQVKQDREREAAIASLVFSLLTAGSMKLLGVYLEHRFFPSFTVGQQVVPGLSAAVPSPARFSAARAAALGGLVEEFGKEALGQARPKADPSFLQPPQPASYRLDTFAGALNLRVELGKVIDAGADMVLEQFRSVLSWMNHEDDFGLAWMAQSNGNLTAARAAVYSFLAGRQKQWAREWEFFGDTPAKIDRDRLANYYERSLWAGYAAHVIRTAQGRRLPGYIHPTYHMVFGRGTGDLEETRDPFGYVGRTVDAAIVDRLRKLNVVFGASVREIRDQMVRGDHGEPTPGVEIKGAVDRKKEEQALLGWAQDHLRRAPVEAVRQFFPTGVKRHLPALAY